MKWELIEHSRNIHEIISRDPKFATRLFSDVHLDNPHCNRELFFKHMDEAKALGIPVLFDGDLFCAMQGKWDKRADKSSLRPEHQNDRYLDSLVDTTADLLLPYSRTVTVVGRGNHEQSVRKRHETDLIERLVQAVKARDPETTMRVGGYTGWVQFSYVGPDKRKNCATKLWYCHGYGGGGPVTKGVIQHNRQAVYVANADIVWNGHTHDTWQLPVPRIRLTRAMTVVHERQIHIRTAGYKEEYGDGYEGWHVETGKPPKPLGCCHVSFEYGKVQPRQTHTLFVDAQEVWR